MPPAGPIRAEGGGAGDGGLGPAGVSPTAAPDMREGAEDEQMYGEGGGNSDFPDWATDTASGGADFGMTADEDEDFDDSEADFPWGAMCDEGAASRSITPRSMSTSNGDAGAGGAS